MLQRLNDINSENVAISMPYWCDVANYANYKLVLIDGKQTMIHFSACD